MSRLQWYVFTVIRLSALGALAWAFGNWLDRTAMSWVAKEILGFLALIIGITVINSSAIRYDTYLEDEEKRSKGLQ